MRNLCDAVTAKAILMHRVTMEDTAVGNSIVLARNVGDVVALPAEYVKRFWMLLSQRNMSCCRRCGGRSTGSGAFTADIEAT